jgi:Zn-dependent protease
VLGSGVEFYLILIIFALPGIALGFTVHEYCHAAAATAYGDPLPRSQGRLSLNPANQVDPLGLILLLFIGFGFARPVMYNPFYVRSGRQRAWVSGAGPLSNLGVVILVGLAIRVVLAADPTVAFCSLPSFALPFMGYIYWFLLEAFYVNVILLFFNLLPIPPLDGFGVAEGLLGSRYPTPFRWLQANRSGIYVALIILVLVVPYLFGGNSPIYDVMYGIFDWLYAHIVSSAVPQPLFPNFQWLFQSSSNLSSALAQPCRFF